MPTLTSIKLDTININFFYTKYPSSFGIAFNEENLTITHPIPAKSTPLACFTKALHGINKNTHFIKAPPTTATTFCLCNKYYTKFITTNNKLYNIPQTDFIPFTVNPKNKKTLKIIADILETTERILFSPTLVTYQHICKKYQQLINCKVSNNQHQLVVCGICP